MRGVLFIAFFLAFNEKVSDLRGQHAGEHVVTVDEVVFERQATWPTTTTASSMFKAQCPVCAAWRVRRSWTADRESQTPKYRRSGCPSSSSSASRRAARRSARLGCWCPACAMNCSPRDVSAVLAGDASRARRCGRASSARASPPPTCADSSAGSGRRHRQVGHVKTEEDMPIRPMAIAQCSEHRG